MKRAVVALLAGWVVGCGSSSKPAPAPAPVVQAEPAPAPTRIEQQAPRAANKNLPRLAPQGTPRTDLISRQILFGNPERANVQVSPDGTRIAWLAPKDGVMNIFVAPVGKLDQAKAITNDTKRPIRSYWWAFDKQHLIYQQDAAGDENWHLFRTSVDGGEVVDLTPYKARAQVQALSWRVPKTMVVGINDRDNKVFDVYAIDIPTGKRTLVYQNDDAMLGFVFDQKLALKVASKVGPDGQQQFFTRSGTKWTLWQEAPFEDADTTSAVSLDANGRALMMRDSRDRDTSALVAIDLASKKKKLVAEDPKSDVGSFAMHPKTDAIQAVAIIYDKQRWHVIDKSVQKDFAAIDKLADGGEWSITSRSLDDNQWLISVATDISAPRYHLYNRAKKTGTFLFAAQPDLPSDKLAKMEPVIIKSRDGLDLVSYLTKPNGATGPVPMMLWVHGGPWGRDRWGYNRFAQLFANRGYAVLQVNFRASSGFGKKFSNAGDKQWGKTMHEDLLDAVEWAVKNNVAPKDRICIGGASYGGYATLAGLTLTPETFACGVDIVGPSNINTLLAATPPYWRPMIIRMKKRMGDFETPEGKAALDAVSPLTHVGKIKRPLLIGQGANDVRVPKTEAEQVVDAMKKLDMPVTYVLFPDEGHGFARPENNIAFMGVAEAFLSAYLGGTYLPLTKEEVTASSMQIKEGKDGVPGLPQ
jgi:dipeptidyl aminopeptidase/acylaminoacyl peptidase